MYLEKAAMAAFFYGSGFMMKALGVFIFRIGYVHMTESDGEYG